MPILSLYAKDILYLHDKLRKNDNMCKLRIKELARERRVTMAVLAAACGYNQPSSLNQAMSRGLRVQQLEAIAGVLGVEVPDLFVRTTQHITCPNCGARIEINVKTKEMNMKTEIATPIE